MQNLIPAAFGGDPGGPSVAGGICRASHSSSLAAQGKQELVLGDVSQTLLLEQQGGGGLTSCQNDADSQSDTAFPTCVSIPYHHSPAVLLSHR